MHVDSLKCDTRTWALTQEWVLAPGHYGNCEDIKLYLYVYAHYSHKTA